MARIRTDRIPTQVVGPVPGPVKRPMTKMPVEAGKEAESAVVSVDVGRRAPEGMAPGALMVNDWSRVRAISIG